MFDAFQGDFTFLKFLSVLAFFTTVGLFFCGIPICRQIWKRKDTTEISGAPFLMGVLGGTCWCVYGWLKGDHTVLYVTGTQILLYSTYTVFYWFMTKKKFWISIKTVLLVAVCSSLVALVHFFGHKIFHPLGIICMTLNTMDFAAPLAGLRVVIRRRATSTLPLPLCIANFMVSSEWFIYGLLVDDPYLITPNGIGSLLAFAQLILFVVLPRKPNQRAPFLRLFDSIRSCCCCCDNPVDLEAAAVVPVDKKMDLDKTSAHRISRHRWSSRVITNVIGDVENVIQKVHLGDQFAYSNKLNKEDERSTDSGTLTPEEQRKELDKVAECNGAPVYHCVDELAVDRLDFGQSARSLKLKAERLQQKLGNFGGMGEGKEEEEETDDEDLSDERDEDLLEAKADKLGQLQQAQELVFPITIRDADQLLSLSRRLPKKTSAYQQKRLKKRSKAGLGFGYSLQQQHLRALGHRQQQPDGVPIIAEEEDLGAVQKKIKRAKSEPNIGPAEN